MKSRTLPGTGITTSPLGLGCAGLHRLPSRTDRDAVVRAALTAGVRHFDTAPMYGLGRSESELARVLGSHRDEVTITTKFGIEPTAFGRALGRVQGPIRAVLARRPALQRTARESGSGPSSGGIGRSLYAASGYNAAAAHHSLHASLRALRTDYIDVFALHDPLGGVVTNAPDLATYLDDQVRAGTIRAWGIAGELPPSGSDAHRLLAAATVIQQRDDVFEGALRIVPDKAVITFGCLSRALPALLDYLGDHPDAAIRWSEQAGMDVREDGTLAELLLREAVRRNPLGVVLFSTTRPDRVPAAVRAVEGSEDPAEALAIRAIVDEVTQRRDPHERLA